MDPCSSQCVSPSNDKCKWKVIAFYEGLKFLEPTFLTEPCDATCFNPRLLRKSLVLLRSKNYVANAYPI